MRDSKLNSGERKKLICCPDSLKAFCLCCIFQHTRPTVNVLGIQSLILKGNNVMKAITDKWKELIERIWANQPMKGGNNIAGKTEY